MAVLRPLLYPLLLIGLLACERAPDDLQTVQARVAAIEAARADDANMIARLQDRLDTLDARFSHLESKSAPSIGVANRPEGRTLGTTEGVGPQCTRDSTLDSLLDSTLDSTLERGAYRLPSQPLLPEDLFRQLRLVPHHGTDGEQDGFRLSGIRRGSTFASCGFRNGDIVKSVNAMPITSAIEALAASEALRDEPVLTVAMVHRGAPVELHLSRVD